MPGIPLQEISTIEEILKLGGVGKAYRSPIIYRGQPVDLPLVPKILRPWHEKSKNILDVLVREKWLMSEFRRQAVGLHPSMSKKTSDIASIAQHHGLPTRMLDWTQNPVAALWFAVEDIKEDEQPVVWRFETKEEDFGDSFDIFNDDPPNETAIFRPNHVTERIRVQSGWFTVHPIKEGKTFPFNKESKFQARLTKFLIHNTTRLRWQLHDMGINRASLFLDLGNLCQHLDWESSWIDRVNKRFGSGIPR